MLLAEVTLKYYFRVFRLEKKVAGKGIAFIIEYFRCLFFNFLEEQLVSTLKH